MATEEELQDESQRHNKNWASDPSFCHVFNQSHECQPICFSRTPNTKNLRRTKFQSNKLRAASVSGHWFALQEENRENNEKNKVKSKSQSCENVGSLSKISR